MSGRFTREKVNLGRVSGENGETYPSKREHS